MPNMLEYREKNLQDFFDIIKPWGAAYAEARFAFIGVKDGGGLLVLQGQLLLGSAPGPSAKKLVDAKTLVAGYFGLSDVGVDFEYAIKRLVSGTLDTPYGAVVIALKEGDAIGAYLNKETQVVGGTQKRITKLTLVGSNPRQQFLDVAACTLELREAETPYSDMNELALECMGVPYAVDSSATIEVIALNVAEVDLSKKITGTRAELGLFVSPLLESAQCALGYRMLAKGAATMRSRLVGAAFTWKRNEEPGRPPLLHGSAAIDVPPGAILQCFATYAGHFQHDGWITDPKTFPNALRMVHGAFDPDLTILRNYLSGKNQRGQNARDFETGIGNLLFMLGFGIDPLFGKPMEDGPDLIAMTREGHIALVECTTSAAIDKGGKLGKLVSRAAMLRADLENAAHNHLRVLPVIVTCHPRSQIAGADDAKGHGVVVLAKEDLEVAIERTMVPQDPDVLFAQAWESVQPKPALGSFAPPPF